MVDCRKHLVDLDWLADSYSLKIPEGTKSRMDNFTKIDYYEANAKLQRVREP